MYRCRFTVLLFTCFAVHCTGAEDEPAPNQYNYNKAKEKCMNKSPSYTIQQGRRGGAVFWMARGHSSLFELFLCKLHVHEHRRLSTVCYCNCKCQLSWMKWLVSWLAERLTIDTDGVYGQYISSLLID